MLKFFIISFNKHFFWFLQTLLLISSNTQIELTLHQWFSCQIHYNFSTSQSNFSRFSSNFFRLALWSNSSRSNRLCLFDEWTPVCVQIGPFRLFYDILIPENCHHLYRNYIPDRIWAFYFGIWKDNLLPNSCLLFLP